MSVFTDLKERVRALLFRGREERELAEELRLHVELEAEKNVAAGMDPGTARREAEKVFGGMDRISEQVRDARGVRAVEEFARDVRHALRSLSRRPGFAAVAVLTLGIGIASSTAMFTLVNGVLLRPLPFAHPDRLVSLLERHPRTGEDNYTSPANVNAWRERSSSFELIAAWTDRPVTVTGEAEPVELRGRWATPEYFRVLGVPARVGRVFQPEEEGQYAVLTHGLWQSRYGGDPDVVGRTLTINAATFTIVGVLPDTFEPINGTPELYLALTDVPRDFRGRFLQGVGRLRDGVSLDAARVELAGIAARMGEETPDYMLNWGVNVTPLHEQMTGGARRTLLILLGAVSLLLLIACANVASLFLSRAATRRREMAVRSSLGAGRGRLIAHAMAEALVIAAVAGVLGLVLAHFALDLALARLPELALPRIDAVALDMRVFAFASGVALLTGLLFGVAPALTGTNVRLATAMREETRTTTGGNSRLRSALIVAEVALALVLLAGAGLLIRTTHNLLNVDTGIRSEGVLTFRAGMTSQRYDTLAARRAFMGELLQRLEALPGVTAAGGIGWLPLSGSKSRTTFFRDDVPRPPVGNEPGADVRVVAGSYFAAMGTPLLRGRLFDETDTQDAPRRYIINDVLARQYFPGEDPLGRQITLMWADEEPGEIIGVVGSIRETTLDEEPSTAIYRPWAQDPWRSMTMLVRTDGAPLGLAPAAVSVVRSLDPNMAVAGIRPMEDVMRATIGRQRLTMGLLSGFAAISLVLVIIGLYGVVAYSVAQRTREIGVRMALGARSVDVLGMVVRQGIGLTLLGLAIGVAGALALGRLVAGLLYGVTPTDGMTLLAASAVLVATGLLASFVPAWRAARIDAAHVLGGDG